MELKCAKRHVKSDGLYRPGGETARHGFIAHRSVKGCMCGCSRDKRSRIRESGKIGAQVASRDPLETRCSQFFPSLFVFFFFPVFVRIASSFSSMRDCTAEKCSNRSLFVIIEIYLAEKPLLSFFFQTIDFNDRLFGKRGIDFLFFKFHFYENFLLFLFSFFP